MTDIASKKIMHSWWRFAAASVALSYGWSWLIWFGSLAATGSIGDNAIILGTFGPSIGGLLLLSILSRGKTEPRTGWLAAFVAGFALAAIALVIKHYASVNANWGLYPPGYDSYRLEASTPAILWSLAICLTSGAILSSARAARELVRRHLHTLVPNRSFVAWVVPVLAFFPVLFLISNLIAEKAGLPLFHQRYVEVGIVFLVAVMLVQILKVAVLTGGNEEVGSRGILLPAMQRSLSPLVAALLIAVIWDLWHLPLVIGGVYGDEGVIATVLMRLRSTVLFSILLTALYNRTHGNVLLCVVLHGAYNVQQTMFAASQVAFIMGLVVILLIIWHQRMWRRDSGYSPSPETNERLNEL